MKYCETLPTGSLPAGKRKRLWKAVVPVFMAVALIYTIYNAVSIWNYGKIDEKCTADAAIVLGAGTSDGKVSPVFRERLNHGVWLYHNGYIRKLILTGGYGGGNEHSDSYTAKQYVISMGIPEKDILLEEKSVITQENIKYAAEIMKNKNYESAILVSDPLHMKRAMLMAGDAGIEAYSSPTPATRYISLKNKLLFLGREVFFYTGYKAYRLFLR